MKNGKLQVVILHCAAKSPTRTWWYCPSQEINKKTFVQTKINKKRERERERERERRKDGNRKSVLMVVLPCNRITAQYKVILYPKVYGFIIK